MVDRPKQTGLDKALEFLSIATGNAGTVIKQRQADLDAYDTEIKRQEAVLNIADVNIAQSKVTGILNQQMADDPEKFNNMSRDDWDDHVYSVMGGQIDVQGITDPISSINLASKAIDISDKGWGQVQKIQSHYATQQSIQDLGYIINAAVNPNHERESMSDLQRLKRHDYRTTPYIDYSDPDTVMDALDSLYEKGRQTGVDMSKVNTKLITFVRENAGTLGAEHGLVREIMEKKLGTIEDRTAIQKGIDTFNDRVLNNDFDGVLQDIFLGESKLSPEDQVIELENKILQTSTPAKRDAMIKQIGNKIVELGNPNYENTSWYYVFKEFNGHAIYDLTSKFATHQANQRKKAAEEERIANLTNIASEIYENPVSSIPALGEFNRLSATDKRDVLSLLQGLIVGDPSFKDSDGSGEAFTKRDAIERSLGMLLPTTQDALRPIDSATRDFLFSTDMYANAEPQVVDDFVTAMFELQRLENAGVNWWKDFDSDQRIVADNMLQVLKYNPKYIEANGVGELIKIGFKGAELEKQGMLPYGLSPSDVRNFDKEVMGGKASKYEAFSNSDYIKNAFYTAYTIARASGNNHAASVIEATRNMEDRIVEYDYKKIHGAYRVLGMNIPFKQKTPIDVALVLPKFLTGYITAGDDSNLLNYGARMKQILDKQPFIQEQMGADIDEGFVLFTNNPTNYNQYVISYRDENGDEIYNSTHDWDTLILGADESILQWSPNR